MNSRAENSRDAAAPWPVWPPPLPPEHGADASAAAPVSASSISHLCQVPSDLYSSNGQLMMNLHTAHNKKEKLLWKILWEAISWSKSYK